MTVIKGASVWEQQLYDHVAKHGRTEGEILVAYEQLANDTEYGLAATFFSTNSSRVHRVAPQLEAGIVWVNSWFLRDLRTAFGGMKHSGIGREGGVHGLEFYTETSNVCVKI